MVIAVEDGVAVEAGVDEAEVMAGEEGEEGDGVFDDHGPPQTPRIAFIRNDVAQ